jgi:hypothetical protein
MFATLGKARYRDPSCVSHVYLGSRMELDKREQITTALRRLGIKMSEMIIDEYFINFKPMS